MIGGCFKHRKAMQAYYWTISLKFIETCRGNDLKMMR
jgi:hypothetical protein